MTGYVVTRWYRAPEVILSWMRYNQTGQWSAAPGSGLGVFSDGCLKPVLETGLTDGRALASRSR